MKRSIVYSFIIVLLLLTIYSSCKKNEPKTGETRLIKGNSAIRNQSWMELRDQARQEFEFYFGTYYHTRDFLGNLDWEHAILYEMDGAKIMVFLFQTRYSDKIDAKLLVKQGDNGQNIYMIRVRSTGSKGKYASIYTANDKVLHLGSIENNAFNEFGRTRMESRTIDGVWPAGCNMCHGGSSEDDWEWDDPVPGGGSLWGNNVLGDVVVEAQGDTYDWIGWNDYWDGPLIVIPAGNGVSQTTQTTDNDPCATFDALMLNAAFRQKLTDLFANTALDHETAFTYDGTTFSPFAHGPVGGNNVTITVYPTTTVEGHSHYNVPTGWYGTFSPKDLWGLYTISQATNNPLQFTYVLATANGCGAMMKITDITKFNNFVSSYIPGGNYSLLEGPSGLYALYQIGIGADATGKLQQLLNSTNAGLKVVDLCKTQNNGFTFNCH